MNPISWLNRSVRSVAMSSTRARLYVPHLQRLQGKRWFETQFQSLMGTTSHLWTIPCQAALNSTKNRTGRSAAH